MIWEIELIDILSLYIIFVFFKVLAWFITLSFLHQSRALDTGLKSPCSQISNPNKEKINHTLKGIFLVVTL